MKKFLYQCSVVCAVIVILLAFLPHLAEVISGIINDVGFVVEMRGK